MEKNRERLQVIENIRKAATINLSYLELLKPNISVRTGTCFSTSFSFCIS